MFDQNLEGKLSSTSLWIYTKIMVFVEIQFRVIVG